MEEWVGRQWHRFISRAADQQHAAAAVQLPQMQRAIVMLFRAAGGAATVRLAPAADARVGGPRGWLQRVAGSGTHAATGRLEAEALSLPPVIAARLDVDGAGPALPVAGRAGRAGAADGRLAGRQPARHGRRIAAVPRSA